MEGSEGPIPVSKMKSTGYWEKEVVDLSEDPVSELTLLLFGMLNGTTVESVPVIDLVEHDTNPLGFMLTRDLNDTLLTLFNFTS